MLFLISDSWLSPAQFLRAGYAFLSINAERDNSDTYLSERRYLK